MAMLKKHHCGAKELTFGQVQSKVIVKKPLSIFDSLPLIKSSIIACLKFKLAPLIENSGKWGDKTPNDPFPRHVCSHG